MRIAFLGDIHGFYEPLLRTLTELGVGTSSMTWPEDLVVVQLGDQVDRGPESEAVADLTEELTHRFPGRFFDVAGNHEAGYLDGTAAPHATETIRDAVHRRRWRALAVGVKMGSGRQIIATHGGLTRPWFRRHTSGTSDTLALAEELNRMWTTRDPACDRRGMVGAPGARPSFQAGPLWAHAGYEVAPSWEVDTDGPPFDQVVGHTGLMWWSRRTRSHSCHKAQVEHLWSHQHSRAMFLNGASIWCIDGHLYNQRLPRLMPLTMLGARHVVALHRVDLRSPPGLPDPVERGMLSPTGAGGRIG